MKQLERTEGIEKICKYNDINAADFWSYMSEDEIGGYHEKDELAKWPCGSIWEIEGQILYALVRALKPKNVVEIGTFHGCSATHIASALVANGAGTLYCVDPAYNDGMIPEPYLDRIKSRPMKHSKFFETTKLKTIDMIFEDGPHDAQTTFESIDGAIKLMPDDGLVVAHDACHFLVGEEVSKGMQRACGDFEKALIEPSDCGLGYWRK